jgi:hypothetical protein
MKHFILKNVFTAMNYPNKSLTQLEKNDWGEPTIRTPLIESCYRLRYKPLNQFTIEDLRLMIGQNISLDYLIPIAIEKLSENILHSGDFFEGDLLKNVLSSDESFWKKNENYWRSMCHLYQINHELFEKNDIYRQIQKSYEIFKHHFNGK